MNVNVSTYACHFFDIVSFLTLKVKKRFKRFYYKQVTKEIPTSCTPRYQRKHASYIEKQQESRPYSCCEDDWYTLMNWMAVRALTSVH